MPEIKIKNYRFDAEKFDAYKEHLRKRLHGEDERPIEEREKERTKLHDELLETCQPKDSFNMVPLKARYALKDYIDAQLGFDVSFFLAYREMFGI